MKSDGRGCSEAWAPQLHATPVTYGIAEIVGSAGPTQSSSGRSGHVLLDAGLRAIHSSALGPTLTPGLHRARFREVDQVEHALRIGASAGLVRLGQHEAKTANLVGILAGFAGHSVDQVDVGHTDFPPGKKGNTDRKNARQREGPTGDEKPPREQKMAAKRTARVGQGSDTVEAVSPLPLFHR